MKRHNLRINPHLAHPPGNQLGHLGAEVNNEDLVVSLLCHAEPLREAVLVCKMIGACRETQKINWEAFYLT